MTLVSGLFTKNPMLIDLVTISFRWQKFTRANLNAFDLDLVLELRFEELQLQIKKSAPDTLLIAKRYSSNLSREEMNNISTALAKTVLDSIRKQTLEKP